MGTISIDEHVTHNSKNVNWKNQKALIWVPERALGGWNVEYFKLCYYDRETVHQLTTAESRYLSQFILDLVFARQFIQFKNPRLI